MSCALWRSSHVSVRTACGDVFEVLFRKEVLVKKTCFNCFHEYEAGEKRCPYCGFPAGYFNRKDYPDALECGSVLYGRYVLGKVLGQGGFGITYLANDYKRNKPVAVKEYFPKEAAKRNGPNQVIPVSHSKSEAFQYGMDRFLDEARTLAEFIGNKNIVKVHRFFKENGTAYFVMDYVKGMSFVDLLKRKGGKISWDEAWAVFSPIVNALGIVHSKGIVHRDVAPDNIVIGVDGHVKLLDFGAARYSMGQYSKSLDVILKRGFAPVEQYTRHGRQGPYTDVYALAATFYVAVTGRVPPESTERMDQEKLIPPRELGADIPVYAEQALLKAMALNSSQRFQTMDEFRRAVLEGKAKEESADRARQRGGQEEELRRQRQREQEEELRRQRQREQEEELHRQRRREQEEELSRQRQREQEEELSRQRQREQEEADRRRSGHGHKNILRNQTLKACLVYTALIPLLISAAVFMVTGLQPRYFLICLALTASAAGLFCFTAVLTGGYLKNVRKTLYEEGITLDELEGDLDCIRFFTLLMGHKYAVISTLFPKVIVYRDLIWCYVVETTIRHKSFFITVAKTKQYSLVFKMRDRSEHKLSIPSKNKDDILREIRNRVPWAIVGYSDDLVRICNNDFGAMIRQVDSKRQERGEG